MQRPDLALLVAFSSSIFSRFCFCFDESPWQPSYDYYHIDLGELGGNHGGLGIKVPVPKDVMVDAVNDLGIKLLAIHNERNDNNIAISPYGALSVLAALSEGLQGDAVHEILHAGHIPKDRHVVRVGLRDIHRHLKSYFIPEEGFLAGLTLNLNNVTLRGEYEDVLRFYGFDYGSFNNALYPEPITTEKPSQSNVLGTTLGLSEGTTIGSTKIEDTTTTVLTDTRFGGATSETNTTEATATSLTTVQEKEETTTGKEKTSTVKEETTKVDLNAATTTTTGKEETTKIDTTVETTTVPSATTRTTIVAETTTESTVATIPDTTTVKSQDTTTLNELLLASDTSIEKSRDAKATTILEENTTEVPTTTTETDPRTTTTDEPAPEGVSISTRISKVTKTSESFEFSGISTYILETTTAILTTEELLATESPTTAAPETTTTTTQEATTSAAPFSLKPALATTSLLTTTTGEPETTFSENIKVSSTAVDTTTTILDTTTASSETTFMTQKTGDVQRTTRQISANMLSDDQLTTLPLSETTMSPQTTTVPTEVPTTLGETTTLGDIGTTLSEIPATLGDIPTTLGEKTTTLGDTTIQIGPEEITTVTFVTPLVPFDTTVPTDAQDDFVNTPENVPTQFFDQTSDVDTTTPFFFETTPDFQDMTTFNQDNFDYNYNYDANAPFTNNSAVDQAPTNYDDSAANLINNNLMVDEPEGASLNRNLKRRARSVVDYVIARFYDDGHRHPYPPLPRSSYPAQQQEPSQIPQYLLQPEHPVRPQYVPQQEPLTFAVYGKYRESGINFMKYDTVLPFFYVPNLKALALSFPLDSTKYYLLLLLPVAEDGADQLICDLRLYGNLRYIIEQLRPTHVVATIPSFMLKGYVTLTPLLQRLGIRRIFEPRQADFSPMTNVTDIYVTNIEQAVTVTIRNYLDPSAQHYKNFRQYSPVHFKADHPFLYFVIDSDLHVALMVGKVINPLNSRIR